jgi:hypothetical protein
MMTRSFPHFHDGAVDSLSLKNNTILEIGIANVNGENYKLILNGLDRLRCLDFRQGNIILDVSIVSGESPDKSALRYLLDLKEDEAPDFLLDKIEKIERGILTFVNITPSYGCEVLALCSDVRLERM